MKICIYLSVTVENNHGGKSKRLRIRVYIATTENKITPNSNIIISITLPRVATTTATITTRPRPRKHVSPGNWLGPSPKDTKHPITFFDDSVERKRRAAQITEVNSRSPK